MLQEQLNQKRLTRVQYSGIPLLAQDFEYGGPHHGRQTDSSFFRDTSKEQSRGSFYAGNDRQKSEQTQDIFRMTGARPVQIGPPYPDYSRQDSSRPDGYGVGRDLNHSYVDPDRYPNNRYSAEKRPRRLKPDDIITFNPKTTDIKFFIRRI